MSKFQKITGIIVIMTIIIFYITSCDLNNDGSLLTVNGLNVNVMGAVVYINGVPTDQMQFLNLVAVSNARAGSTNRSSPFYLTDRNDKAFKQSGTFFVVLTTGSINYYLSGVVFHNGSATINFSDMSKHTNLPLM